MKIIAVLILLFLLSGFARALEVPLDAKESFLKFTGHAFMHDFNGEAKEFHGSAQIDVKKPEIVLGAEIDIQAAKMTTFESTRDRNMFDWLHVDMNPEISFQLKKAKLMKDDFTNATTDHPAQFAVNGNFNLNKITKPLETQVFAWREGKWLVATGMTRINTADHGLPEIRQLFMTVEKQVDIGFRLIFDLPPELQVTVPHQG